jgi:hypothetical protein
MKLRHPILSAPAHNHGVAFSTAPACQHAVGAGGGAVAVALLRESTNVPTDVAIRIVSRTTAERAQCSTTARCCRVCSCGLTLAWRASLSPGVRREPNARMVVIADLDLEKGERREKKTELGAKRALCV